MSIFRLPHRPALTSTLALCGLLLGALPLAAHADIAPSLNDSCPSGYTKGTNTAGKARCDSPRDQANKAKAAESKNARSAGKSSSKSASKGRK